MMNDWQGQKYDPISKEGTIVLSEIPTIGEVVFTSLMIDNILQYLRKQLEEKMRETEERKKEHEEMLIKKKEKTEELITKQKEVKLYI